MVVGYLGVVLWFVVDIEACFALLVGDVWCVIMVFLEGGLGGGGSGGWDGRR